MGCFRGIEADGMSTLHWAKLAKELCGSFTSVDANPRHVEMAKQLLVNHELQPAQVTLGESVAWLRAYAGPKIDLLYLDSLDSAEATLFPAQLHQLEEFQLARRVMSSTGIILVDDVYHARDGGKAALTLPAAANCGLWVITREPQAIILPKTMDLQFSLA